MTEPTGTILHIQRLSTEDGPGIRTTVFLKGCPLHCAWCHNPESISPRHQVVWHENRCMACRSCVEICPNRCLTLDASGLYRDRTRCTACGACVEACPTGAMEILGHNVTVSALCSELVKDRAYYEKSGGGVTLSGGEPSLQPEFSNALIHKLREVDISTALDTCGLCTPETLDNLVDSVDLVLYDLKFIDSAAHEFWTGSPNRRILENLARLGKKKSDNGFRLWVRTPLIPGATYTEENILEIGGWLGQEMAGAFDRWELCAFNNLCQDKYRRLDMEWEFANTPLLTHTELENAARWAVTSGINPTLISVTGAARAEKMEMP